jgi:hypothetical protein
MVADYAGRRPLGRARGLIRSNRSPTAPAWKRPDRSCVSLSTPTPVR